MITGNMPGHPLWEDSYITDNVYVCYECMGKVGITFTYDTTYPSMIEIAISNNRLLKVSTSAAVIGCYAYTYITYSDFY